MSANNAKSNELGFTVYVKDVPALHVTWKRTDINSIKTEQLCAEMPLKITPKLWNGTCNFVDVQKFVETRVVPRTRFNIDEVLHDYGLPEYLPIQMCRKSHGVSMSDYLWIKFDDEDITWNDVKLRD